MSDAVFDAMFVRAVERIDFPSSRWRYLLSATDLNDNSIAQQLQANGFAAKQVKDQVDLINGQTTDFLIRTYLGDGLNAEVACAALQLRTSKADKDRVLELLESSVADERTLAVRALTYKLGESFQSEIIPRLYELSKVEQEAPVLEALCYAMYHLGADERVSHLKHLVAHGSPSVRFALAACFFGTDDSEGINCLVSLSRDEDPEVRNWATTALGQSIKYLDDPAPLKQTFVERLDDEERDTRLEAVSALSKFQEKDKKALAVLISELGSDPVPLIAIEAAISFASPELTTPLRQLLDRTEIDDPNSDIIRQAISA